MIQWWGAILIGFGLTVWSLFCMLIGASLSMNADKKLKEAEAKGKGQQNPRMN